jgi:hypothetical protein
MAALAFLFKQNTGLLILLAVELRVLSQRGRVLDPLVGLFAVTGPWLVALVIAMGGHLDRLAGFVGAVSQGGLFAPPQPSIILPLAALGAGLWLVRRDPDPRLRWVLVAGSALFVTQFPRMDTLHLAWSAPLLLIVGMAVLERARMPRLYVLAALALTLAAAPTLLWRTRSFLQPSVPIDQVGFAKGLLVPEQTRADLTGVLGDLNARMSSGEPIFVYPSSPLLYALADRPNPTRFEHLYPGALSAPELRHVLNDLRSAGVRVVVVSDFWQHAWGPPGDNQVIEEWIARDFVEVARYGTYRVLERAYNGA